MASNQIQSNSAKGKKGLITVLFLTGIYLVVEVIGGVATGSLALLADAGHMLTDVGGLAVALVAIKLAEKPADSRKTFGYYRFEILASLVNAIILIGLSLYILVEAYKRFNFPGEVQTTGMLIVAFVGLVINVIGIKILNSGSESSLNMKGAYFEILSDLLTSVGVIVGAIAIWFTGFSWIDPLISAGIGLFILPRTWILLKESVDVILEGTPKGIDLVKIRATVLDVSGVSAVHDVHAWSITSGMVAMSAHIQLHPNAAWYETIQLAKSTITSKYPIHHVTLEPEPSGKPEGEAHT